MPTLKLNFIFEGRLIVSSTSMEKRTASKMINIDMSKYRGRLNTPITIDMEKILSDPTLDGFELSKVEVSFDL